MVPNSFCPSFQPWGCVRLPSKVKGNLERVQEPALNRLRPDVSSPPDGRSMGDPIWGIFLLAIFRVPFFRSGEKRLEAISGAAMGHILGPKSLVSIPSLMVLSLAMVTEMWYGECRQFRPFFSVFAIFGLVGNTITPWNRRPSQDQSVILVA